MKTRPTPAFSFIAVALLAVFPLLSFGNWQVGDQPSTCSETKAQACSSADLSSELSPENNYWWYSYEGVQYNSSTERCEMLETSHYKVDTSITIGPEVGHTAGFHGCTLENTCQDKVGEKVQGKITVSSFSEFDAAGIAADSMNTNSIQGCEVNFISIDSCWSTESSSYEQGYCVATYEYTGESSSGSNDGVGYDGPDGTENTDTTKTTTSTITAPPTTTTNNNQVITESTTTTTETLDQGTVITNEVNQVTLTDSSGTTTTTETQTQTTTNTTTGITTTDVTTTITATSPTTTTSVINSDGTTTTTTTEGGDETTSTQTNTTTVDPDGTVTSDTTCEGEACNDNDDPWQDEEEQDYGTASLDSSATDDAFQGIIDSINNTAQEGISAGNQLPVIPSLSLGASACVGMPYDLGKYGQGTFDTHCAYYDTYMRPVLTWAIGIWTVITCFGIWRDSVQRTQV